MSEETNVEEIGTVEEEGTPARPLLSEEDEKEIADFLCEELRLAELERIGETKRWATIRRMREGEPEFQKKDTPWPDASNVVPPGMMIAANTVYGMEKNALGAKKPFWSVKAFRAQNDAEVRIAKAVERYMQLLADSRSDLNKREMDREIADEQSLLGTVFVKVHWTTHTHEIPLPAPDGTSETTTVLFHDGPEWIVVPREDAFYRTRERSVQTARWWAHRLELEEADVEERFADGRWREFDTWKNYARTEATDEDIKADARAGAIPGTRKVWDFYEVFLRWDISPKDGKYEELILVFHKGAREIVASKRNDLGVRPVRELNFIKRARRLDGMGVGHAGMHMQAELETQHNQRMDSVHFSGLRMLIARKNCGIKPREILKPGKILFVDDIKQDVMPFQAGEVYPSSLQSESLTWQYLQKATLMSDTMSGFSDETMKTRDSIGLQVNRMKATSGILGSILESLEDGYSDLGLFTFYHLIYNKTRVLENERKWQRLSDEELKDLETALSIPLDEVPVRLIFSVRTSDVDQTYEQRQQNAITLVSLYSMFQKQTLPLLIQLYTPNPQTGQPMFPAEVQKFIMRLVTGNSKLFEKLSNFLGEDDTDELLPDYKKMELMLDIQDALEGRVVRQMEGVRDAIERRENQGQNGGVGSPTAGSPGTRGPSGMAFPVESGGGNTSGRGQEAGAGFGRPESLPIPGM